LSSEASDRKLRQRIRTRIRDSAVDLQLGFRRLEDEDFQRAFQSNLEPIREFRDELEDFDQNNRVFMRTSEDAVENIERLRDTVAALEESHYEFTTLMMDLNETSTSGTTDRKRESRDLRDAIESKVQTMKSEADQLKDNAERLEQLDKDTRDRLQRFKNRAEQLKMVVGTQTQDLQEWIGIVEQRSRATRNLVERAHNLSRSVDDLAHANVDQRDEWEEYFTEISSILQGLQDDADELREWRNRRAHGRLPRFAFRDLSRLSFDPGMRDTVVDSIAFFLRAASVAGANQERILEEAITTNIQTQQPDTVMDTVDVTIETENRQRALQSANEKHSYEQFSNAELRALAESEDDRLQQMTQRVRPSHQDPIDHILDEPSSVEEGLLITSMQVPIEYHDLEILVDLVGKDADEQLVLIDVLESASQEQIKQKMGQLDTLLNEVDLEEDGPARGIVVVDTVTDEAGPHQMLDSAMGRIKVRQLE
jgi:ABC-type transporter Mla subunit MlaD